MTVYQKIAESIYLLPLSLDIIFLEPYLDVDSDTCMNLCMLKIVRRMHASQFFKPDCAPYLHFSLVHI